jgi:hypothetical protein
MPSKKRRLAQLEGEKKKIAKTPGSSFFLPCFLFICILEMPLRCVKIVTKSECTES